MVRCCPLAWGKDGDAIDVPASAVAWGVRRLISNVAGGAPQVVYGPGGTPLQLELDAAIGDLAEAVGGRAGKYRLDPLDANGKRLTGVTVQAAYVVVGDASAGAGATELVPAGDTALSPALAIVAQMAKAHGDAMERVVERVSSQIAPLVDAATKLVEAVDSAGVSKRPPPPVVEAQVVEVSALPAAPEPSAWRPVVDAVMPQVPVLLQALMAFVASRSPAAAATVSAASTAP